MKHKKNLLQRGQGLVEYALLLMLVSVSAILALEIFGETVQAEYCKILNGLGTTEDFARRAAAVPSRMGTKAKRAIGTANDPGNGGGASDPGKGEEAATLETKAAPAIMVTAASKAATPATKALTTRTTTTTAATAIIRVTRGTTSRRRMSRSLERSASRKSTPTSRIPRSSLMCGITAAMNRMSSFTPISTGNRSTCRNMSRANTTRSRTMSMFRACRFR